MGTRLSVFFKKAIVTGIFFWGISCAQQLSFAQHADTARMRQHVYKLASDKMQGRGTGSRELKRAARYIKRHFRMYGLHPAAAHRYEQPFIARLKRVTVTDSLRKTANILGFLDNGAPYTILIGAHYDHLGLGRQGSSKDTHPEGKIHNGADDNASGVAGLLELARYFSQNRITEPYNLLFIAFSAEELGLLGSAHFVSNPTISLKNIHFMLNMDMIGRYDAARGIGIGGYGTSPSWPAIFRHVQTPINYFTDPAGQGGSDHHSFYGKDIPVLFFHTGGHADYHMPGDDPEKINYGAMAGIIDLGIQLIEHAMKQPKLPFSTTN